MLLETLSGHDYVRFQDTTLDDFLGPPTEAEQQTVRNIIHDLISDFNNGVPLPPRNWRKFPGYSVDALRKYKGALRAPRKQLPSSSELQKMFTTNMPSIDKCIGAIDFIDSFDLMMLHHIMRPENRWVVNESISIDDLTDCGPDVHGRRISTSAVGSFSGDLTLVSVIAALFSVIIVQEMHNLGSLTGGKMHDSVKRARVILEKWCGL
jgi:hypothetical protein